MSPHTLLYLFYGLTGLAAVLPIACWLRGKWRERHARKHQRLAFYTSPFLAHWAKDKHRQNVRIGGPL